MAELLADEALVLRGGFLGRPSFPVSAATAGPAATLGSGPAAGPIHDDPLSEQLVLVQFQSLPGRA